MRLARFFGIGALLGGLLGSAAFLGSTGVAAPASSRVTLDQAVNGGGSTSFSISTSNPNEVIVIAVDGWPALTPSSVTVDGNEAKGIVGGTNAGVNTGFASIYVYTAPTAGSHAIAIDESGIELANNMAVSLIGGSITGAGAGDSGSDGTTGDSLTTTAGAYILYDADFDTGNCTIGTFSWSGSPVVPTTLTSLHTGCGNDSVFGGESASSTGTYSANVTDSDNSASEQSQDMVAIPFNTCPGIGNNYSGENCAYYGFRGANLNNANFSGANLTGANLTGVNLNNANLTNANLTNANLTNANLTNANLSGANLSGADLDDATTSNADFNGVKWSNTTCPDGTNSSTNSPKTCTGHGA